MNTPSSVKSKNYLDHIIYMPLLFFSFWFLFFCGFVLKKPQVGLRLPDRTHMYSNKGFSYSIYSLYGGWGGGGLGERREERKNMRPTPKKERKKSHNRKIYLPNIMEECAPQTDGSAQADVLLVFLRDLVLKKLKQTGDFEIIQSWQKFKPQH